MAMLARFSSLEAYKLWPGSSASPTPFIISVPLVTVKPRTQHSEGASMSRQEETQDHALEALWNPFGCIVEQRERFCGSRGFGASRSGDQGVTSNQQMDWEKDSSQTW
jgi:hypothetical protein